MGLISSRAGPVCAVPTAVRHTVVPDAQGKRAGGALELYELPEETWTDGDSSAGCTSGANLPLPCAPVGLGV